MAIETINTTTHYVTIKNYNRGNLFYELADYQYCLSRIGLYAHQYGLLLHAYVLMPNHMYLLLTAARTTIIITALEMFELDYGEYFNFYYRRVRKLLELDISMLPVDADQHLLMYCRYIELAPVRSRLIQHPADYHWSSYGCNAMGEDTGMLTLHEKYLALGVDEQTRRSSYRGLFEENGPADLSGQRAVA